MATTPRLRRRDSHSVLVLPGDNKPERVPRFSDQLAHLLSEVTHGRVRIAYDHNGVDGTEFVLSASSMEPSDRAAIERAVPQRLHALWSCQVQDDCLLEATGAAATSQDQDPARTPRMHRSGVARMQPTRTLVVRRLCAPEPPRPLWLSAAYVGTGAMVQSWCLYALYWIYTNALV